jgi:hypothetical protein
MTQPEQQIFVASVTLSPTPTPIPKVTVTFNEVRVPDQIRQSLIIELALQWKVLDWITFFFSLGSLTLLALYIRTKPVQRIHLTYIATWLLNNILYYSALFLNRAGFLTIEYSDLFFLKWAVLLRFHIVLSGTILLVQLFIREKRHGRSS